MSFLKNMAIKSVTKRRTKELINYLEDGPKIDFLEALKRYNKENVGIDYIDCSSWVQLFIHIIWSKVTRELYYDPSIGKEEDAYLIGDIVMKELRKWEKVIKTRADRS